MEIEDLNPSLWHLCAGELVRIPPVHSNAYYFPQGHLEHAATYVNFLVLSQVSPQVECRVSSIKYLADAETGEVYARIGLVPLKEEASGDEGDVDSDGEKEDVTSFVKTLTESDMKNTNGGWELCVPRECAETIFPRLDESTQTILAKDVQGKVWELTHHLHDKEKHLLSMSSTGSAGWTGFVKDKKMVAGDSIVLVRYENGDICLGIRKAKRQPISPLHYGIPNEVSLKKENGGNVSAKSVREAIRFAANGHRFEVDYYPRASTPEFVVRYWDVNDAVKWNDSFSELRFKMAFEVDNRIRWYEGSITCCYDYDPVHWPNSPWRNLQVDWKEGDFMQNRRVNPWLVELDSVIPRSMYFRGIYFRYADHPRLPEVVMDYGESEIEEDGAITGP